MTAARRPPPRPIRLAGIDVPSLRSGRYADAYFLNAARVLRRGAAAGERHTGLAPAMRGAPPERPAFVPGRAEVEMQVFARRRPWYLAAGIRPVLGLLRDGALAATAGARRPRLEVHAVPEGTRTPPLRPVLVLRGRYTGFAHLETAMIGVLARASRIATNVYEALDAARGKPVLFFPARFDLPQTQALDGHAYRVAIEAYGRRTGRRLPVAISSDSQGALWGGRGSGTVPHAFILCHLGDTAEAMLSFCRHLPADVRRVALVDTTNDCVGESLRTARRLFEEYLRHLRAGRRSEAGRYVLHGVRADTAADLRDRSVPPTADPRSSRGVTPLLTRRIRIALDAAPASLGLRGRWLREAERYFRGIAIVATGGFDADRIRRFVRSHAPVDAYGVGSWFLRGTPCDFTADIVRVRISGRWVVTAKTGRGPRGNRALRRVRLW